jgi:hypothetical protein
VALTSHGIQVISGGRRRNGADRLLLDHARSLKEQGVNRFMIASNDHRFARVATLGELHVLTLNGAYVSERLRAAAATVTVLGRHGAEWRLVTSAFKAQGLRVRHGTDLGSRHFHPIVDQTRGHFLADHSDCRCSSLRCSEPDASGSEGEVV